MKKRIAFRKLGRTTEHRLAMFRNMLCSLIEHERIRTTVPKAKDLRRWGDQAVGYAKRWATHQQAAYDAHLRGEAEVARQSAAKAQHQLKLASSIVRQRPVLIKLLHCLGPRYLQRDGGYTRVLKLQKRRAGDQAPMAVIEYVDRPGELRRAKNATYEDEDGEDVLEYEEEQEEGEEGQGGEGGGGAKERQQQQQQQQQEAGGSVGAQRLHEGESRTGDQEPEFVK